MENIKQQIEDLKIQARMFTANIEELEKQVNKNVIEAGDWIKIIWEYEKESIRRITEKIDEYTFKYFGLDSLAEDWVVNRKFVLKDNQHIKSFVKLSEHEVNEHLENEAKNNNSIE